MAKRDCNVFTSAPTGVRVSAASSSIATYLSNTAVGRRSTGDIMKVMTGVRLVNKYKGNYYVNKGSKNSVLSDQLNGIEQVNSYVKKYFGAPSDLIVVDKIKSSPTNSGYNVVNSQGQMQWQTQDTFGVKIDPVVLSSLREEARGTYNALTDSQEELTKAYKQMDMFKSYGEEVSDLVESVAGKRYVEGLENYLDMIGRPQGEALSETVISEMALRENSSEQRFSNAEQIELGKIKLQAERLQKVFGDLGISVKVVYDPSIPSIGKIGPGRNGGVVITLNPDRVASDTAYHEYGHLYIDMLGYNHPAVKAAIQQLRGSSLYTQVLAKYPELAKDQEMLDKEVLATAIGIQGARIESKNPNKLQQLFNRFFRFIAKKLGITNNAAAQLAQDLFAGTINPAEFGGTISLEEQESRGLEGLSKDLAEAKVNAVKAVQESLDMAQRSTTPESKSAARALKVHKERLNNIEKAEEFVGFVDYVNQLFNKAQSDFEDIERRSVDLVNIDEEERLKLINMLGNISNYMRAYYDRGNINGVMNNIANAVEEKLNQLQKKKDITQQELDNITVLRDKVVYLNHKMGQTFQKYIKVGIPLQASLMLNLIKNSQINEEIEKLAKSIEDGKVMRNNLLVETEVTLKIRDDFRKGKIKKEERNNLLREELVKQIRGREIGLNNLIAELTNAQMDKTKYSVLADPMIYSSQTGLQLFLTEMKAAVLEAAEKTRDVQFDLSKDYMDFMSRKGGFNATQAYANMYEVVSHYIVEQDNDGNNVRKKIQVLSFVQPYDVSRYYDNLYKMIDEAEKKYGKPNYGDREAYKEWKTSKDPKFVELRKGYYRTIDEWHAKNSIESPLAKKRKADLEKDLKTVEKEYYKYKDTDVDRAALALVEMEQIESDINFIYNSYNNTFRGDAVMPNDSYKNPRYTALQNNAADFKYYQKLLDIYNTHNGKIGETKQVKNSWDTYTYQVPTVKGSTLEQMQSSGFLAASKDMLKDAFTITAGDTEYGELSAAQSRKQIVPIYFTGHMDPSLVTRDLTGAIMHFVKMANEFESKSKIQSSVILMRDIIQNRRVLKQGALAMVPVVNQFARRNGYIQYETAEGVTSNTYQMVEEAIESIFFGRKDLIQNFAIGSKTIDVNKAAATFARFTAVKSLAFNGLQATNQLFLDNQKLIEEGMVGQYFNKTNHIWALGKFMSSFGGVSDWGAFAPKSKMIKVALWCDAYSDQLGMDQVSNLTGSKLKKSLEAGASNILQSMAEHEAVLVRMLALMDSYKGKLKDKDGNVLKNADGTDANLYDMLIEKANGNIELDPRVANMDQLTFVNKLSGLMKRTNQVKGDFDRALMERRAWGKMVNLFRRFFSPQLRKHWGYGSNRGVHIDTESGVLANGMYKVFINYMNQATRSGFKYHGVYGKHTEWEQADIKRVFSQIGWVVTTGILGGMLREDDDDQVSQFFAYQAIRMNAELQQFYNYNDFVRLLKSPTATINTMDAMFALGEQALFYDLPYTLGFDVDKEKLVYQKNTDGYKKGTRKIIKLVDDNVPYAVGVRKTLNPEKASEFYEK